MSPQAEIARGRPSASSPPEPRSEASGAGLLTRIWLLDAIRLAYPSVTRLLALVMLALGGLIPVLRRWLSDDPELQSWSDVVAALGGFWIARSEGARHEDLGLPLSRANAPRLFNEIVEISRKLGARPPAETHLTYLPCCGVVDWGKRGHEPVLVLGLPLMDVLTEDELRAVLAHELAHLARGDAARSAWAVDFVTRLADAARGTQAPTGWRRLNPLRAWAMLCLSVGQRCVGPVARGQETRADHAAAVIAGGGTAASALVKTALVQPLFRQVLETYDPRSTRYPNLYVLFRDFWTRLPEPMLTSMRHHVLSTRAADDDPAHPDLIDRLAAVQAVSHRVGRATGPATHLLGDVEAFERLLHERLFGLDRPEPSVFHRAGSG